MMPFVRRLAYFAALLLPQASHASADEAARRCAGLEDNVRRLACYDQAFAVRMPIQKTPLDLVQTVNESLENKETTLVFHNEEGATAAAKTEPSPLGKMYDLDANSPSGLLSVREHNPMYLLPLWYNSSPNYYPYSPSRGITSQERFSQQKHAETKMQISFKSKILEDLFRTRADLWFGYTQKSDWQIYNQGRKSAPFRNTDYEPEVFITQPVKAALPGGGRLRMLGAGFVHQSNGQTRPESRSWNRVYAMAGLEWGKLAVIPRLWARLDANGDKDDNPDIGHYMGHGDLKLQYSMSDKQNVSATFRLNPKSGKGAAETAYVFPIKGKLKGIVRGFHGYGESLIDYNHKQTGIGVGVMFNDWDGL